MSRQIHSDRRTFVCKDQGVEKPTNLPCHLKWRKVSLIQKDVAKLLTVIQSQGYNHLLYFTAITKERSLIKTFKIINAKISVKIGRRDGHYGGNGL